MLVNKKNDMTPYDMARRPAKQYPFLLPVMWLGSFVMTLRFNLKIDKSGLKGIKPPYIVLATHQGFSDYYIAPLAMFPRRAMFVSDMEGFAGFGNWLYRGFGCIPKRRYVNSMSVVKNIKYGLSQGQAVFVYPESRHSNVGTTSYIPKNMGKFAKSMNVPLVILSCNGSYLANPFWDEEHTRNSKIRAKMELICTKEELNSISADELQTIIEQKLNYDEYRYQKENNILIKDKNRAVGLHKALYQCKNCNTLFNMTSYESFIKCNKCNNVWELSEDGSLIDKKTSNEIHIPDYYEWQRSEAIKNLPVNPITYKVRIEALPNEFGFINMGEGELEFNLDEFILKFKDKELHFPHKIRESVQTEYNYRGKGSCIVLSTSDCCYYIYSDDLKFQPTYLQFLGEYLYSKK